MRERPILFSGPMVRALLAGTKTQTRRVVKPQPDSTHSGFPYWNVGGYRASWCRSAADGGPLVPANPLPCPYGQPGDRLWVRETHMNWWKLDPANPEGPRLFSHVAAYAADGYELEPGERWIPSIHMLRAASRILLEIKAVRVERLQDISHADAAAEGCDPWVDLAGVPGVTVGDRFDGVRRAYQHLWNQIHGPDSWAANPWVWVVEFERAKASEKGKKQ